MYSVRPKNNPVHRNCSRSQLDLRLGNIARFIHSTLLRARYSTIHSDDIFLVAVGRSCSQVANFRCSFKLGRECPARFFMRSILMRNCYGTMRSDMLLNTVGRIAVKFVTWDGCDSDISDRSADSPRHLPLCAATGLLTQGEGLAEMQGEKIVGRRTVALPKSGG